MEEGRSIIVERQLKRGFNDMKEAREYEVITRRHPLYIEQGDIQIFSAEHPTLIASQMIKELTKLGINFSQAN